MLWKRKQILLNGGSLESIKHHQLNKSKRWDLITSLGASLEPLEVEPQQVFFFGVQTHTDPHVRYDWEDSGYWKTEKIW